MIVGCLGDIIFAVFDGYVKTIKDMAQSVSARYTTEPEARHWPSLRAQMPTPSRSTLNFRRTLAWLQASSARS